MKSFHAAVAIAVGVTALVSTAGTASAETTTPNRTAVQSLVSRVSHAPDPKAAYDKLPSVDKKAFMAAAQSLVSRVSHAPDSKMAFNNLSSADKKLFREVTTPYGAPKVHSGKLPRGMFSRAYSGCWGHSDVVEEDNVLGWKLANGYQRTNICASNGHLTKEPWIDNVGGTGAWAWSYDSAQLSTLNAGWEGRGAARFAYTVYGTPGKAYLCLRIFVNSNGYNWRKDKKCRAEA